MKGGRVARSAEDCVALSARVSRRAAKKASLSTKASYRPVEYDTPRLLRCDTRDTTTHARAPRTNQSCGWSRRQGS
eukprot:3935729-Prymnesium_polylepis.1